MFYFNKPHKSWRKAQSPLSITYFPFSEDKELSAVEVLNEYTTLLKTWKKSNHEKKLLLSLIRPGMACSIYHTRLAFKTFKQAAINIDLFKAHSKRSASCSKSSMAGAPS